MRPFAGGREPTFEKFQVWRGNDDVCVELAVTKSTREKIVRADSITHCGKRYRYERERFRNILYFSGGLDGKLEVCYGEVSTGDCSGRGLSAHRNLASLAQYPPRKFCEKFFEAISMKGFFKAARTVLTLNS